MRLIRVLTALQIVLPVLLFAGCSAASVARVPIAAATVALRDANGAPVGTAQLRQEAGGLVHVDVTMSSLSPGPHGIHFHEVGRCDGAGAFSTAGAHYNPLSKEHGLSRPGGPHAGDAPNLTAGNDGRGTLSSGTDRVTLTIGSTSLFDTDGSSLVVHAAPDDQMSQPSGNSGARVACGVVQSVR